MRSAIEEVFCIEHCLEAFDNALREAEVAASSGDAAKLAEALHSASDLIEKMSDCIDPPRQDEPNVDPLAELRARVLNACERLLPRSSLH